VDDDSKDFCVIVDVVYRTINNYYCYDTIEFLRQYLYFQDALMANKFVMIYGFAD
jgi:hypothetical protein